MSYDLHVFALAGAADAAVRFMELAVAAEAHADSSGATGNEELEQQLAGSLEALQVWFEGGDELATITIPYWDTLDRSRLAAEIRVAASILGDAGYTTLYDPQLDRAIDPVRDVDAVLEKFQAGVELTRSLTAGEPAGEVYKPLAARRRRWWRRR